MLFSAVRDVFNPDMTTKHSSLNTKKQQSHLSTCSVELFPSAEMHTIYLSIYLVEHLKCSDRSWRNSLNFLYQLQMDVLCVSSPLYSQGGVIYFTFHPSISPGVLACISAAVGVACISRCLPWQVSAIFCLGPRINKCQRWAGLGSDLMHSRTAELTSDPDTTLQLILRQHSHGAERKLDFDGHSVITSLGRH